MSGTLHNDVLEYPEQLVYVRARCPLGHSWVTELLVKLPPPRSRAALDPRPVAQQLAEPHCPNCMRHHESYTNTAYG